MINFKIDLTQLARNINNSISSNLMEKIRKESLVSNYTFDFLLTR